MIWRFNLLLFFLFSFALKAQKEIRVHYIDIESKALIEVVKIEQKDSLSFKRSHKKLLDKLLKKNHVLASIDSVYMSDSLSYAAEVYVGPKISQLEISLFDEETKSIVRIVPGINEKFIRALPFRDRDLIQFRTRILGYLENNGYPFAQILFDQIEIADVVKTRMRIVKGPQVSWKKVTIKGDLKLSRSYILTLIDIKPGAPYSEIKFQKVNSRLSQVSFITLVQAPQIAFFEDGVELFLYLSPKQSSTANGILGMQPNDAGKVTFTGDVQLRLENALSVGERIALVWKNLLPQTPQLDVGLNFPFLFKTKFGIDAAFHIYKRDTSFLEVRGNLGIRYFLGNNNFIKGFYTFENSSLLNGAVNNPLFADGLSVRTNGYGLGFERQLLDYLPNPRKGVKLETSIVFGTRNTFPQNSDNLTLPGTKANVFRGNLRADYFIPFGKRSTFRLGALFDFYHADTIYANEQIRFGGLQTLRGFDEEALFATTMSRLTLEYRFLLDMNSHILLFFDQVMYENRTRNYFRDLPFGFGAGLSFGTKVGMFSIIYGIGGRYEGNIPLREGKIHIGYLALF